MGVPRAVAVQVVQDKGRHGRRLVLIQPGQALIGQPGWGNVAGHGQNSQVVRIQGRLAIGCPIDLYFGYGFLLITLYQHQIPRGQG